MVWLPITVYLILLIYFTKVRKLKSLRKKCKTTPWIRPGMKKKFGIYIDWFPSTKMITTNKNNQWNLRFWVPTSLFAHWKVNNVPSKLMRFLLYYVSLLKTFSAWRPFSKNEKFFKKDSWVLAKLMILKVLSGKI